MKSRREVDGKRQSFGCLRIVEAVVEKAVESNRIAVEKEPERILKADRFLKFFQQFLLYSKILGPYWTIFRQFRKNFAQSPLCPHSL